MSASSTNWITKVNRLAIYLRDAFTCVYCLKDLHDSTPRHITLDHVVPRQLGGSHKPHNLVTACLSCNSRRGLKPLSKFCDEETRNRVRKHTRRSTQRHAVLARDLIVIRSSQCQPR